MTNRRRHAEQDYQANYYQNVTKERRQGRWATDMDYRENEQERARRRRALARAETADVRFEEMIQSKKDQTRLQMVERAARYGCPTCGAKPNTECSQVTEHPVDDAQMHLGRYKHLPTQVPRDVWVGKQAVLCYSSGSLARESGREARTICLWLSLRILPGATAFFAVDTKPDAYFSVEFCAAVKLACRRLYRLDARFPRSKLRGLVLEELACAKESYIPVGGTDDDRVWPHQAGGA